MRSVDTALASDVELLRRYMVLLKVSTLVSYRLDTVDLMHFWRAIRYTRVGRRFPSLVENTHDLVWLRQFHGCELQCQVTKDNRSNSKPNAASSAQLTRWGDARSARSKQRIPRAPLLSVIC